MDQAEIFSSRSLVSKFQLILETVTVSLRSMEGSQEWRPDDSRENRLA